MAVAFVAAVRQNTMMNDDMNPAGAPMDDEQEATPAADGAEMGGEGEVAAPAAEEEAA